MKPTIGRVVYYRPTGTDGPIHAALIAEVHSDSLINLGVVDSNGDFYGKSSVQLVSPGETPPQGAYAHWMDFQVRQAVEAEAISELVQAAVQQRLKVGEMLAQIETLIEPLLKELQALGDPRETVNSAQTGGGAGPACASQEGFAGGDPGVQAPEASSTGAGAPASSDAAPSASEAVNS